MFILKLKSWIAVTGKHKHRQEKHLFLAIQYVNIGRPVQQHGKNLQKTQTQHHDQKDIKRHRNKSTQQHSAPREQPGSDHWQQLHARGRACHGQWCVPVQWGLSPPWSQQPPVLRLQVQGTNHGPRSAVRNSASDPFPRSPLRTERGGRKPFHAPPPTVVTW